MAHPYWGFAQAIGWLHPEPEPEWSDQPVHPPPSSARDPARPGSSVRRAHGAGRPGAHPPRGAHRRGLRAGGGLRTVPRGGAVPPDPPGPRRAHPRNAVLGSDGYGYVPVAGKHEKIPQAGWVEVGDDVEIGACTTVDRGVLGPTRIQAGSKIDNQVPDRPQRADRRALPHRVPDRHSGSTTLGHHVTLAGKVGAAGHIHIGSGTTAAGNSMLGKDVPENSFVSGYLARPHRQWLECQAALNRLPGILKELKRHSGQGDPAMLHRLIYADWEAPPEAMAFEAPLGELLEKIRRSCRASSAGWRRPWRSPRGCRRPTGTTAWPSLATPAMVNVALNYKICVEQGLPLHPTHYFEVSERTRFKENTPATVAEANQCFWTPSPPPGRSRPGPRRARICWRPTTGNCRRASTGSSTPASRISIPGAPPTPEDPQPGRPGGQGHAAGHHRRRRPRLDHVRPGVRQPDAGAPLLHPLLHVQAQDTAPIVADSDRAFLGAYAAGPPCCSTRTWPRAHPHRVQGRARPLFQASSTASVLRHSLSRAGRTSRGILE